MVMHGRLEASRAVVALPHCSEVCQGECGSANASTVRDTPLNGRDWAALATPQAGVSSVQNEGFGRRKHDRGFGRR
jgi:hypothetical protein